MRGRTTQRLGNRLALLSFTLMLVASTHFPVEAAQRTPAQEQGTPTTATTVTDTGFLPVSGELGVDLSLSPDGQWLVTWNPENEGQLCLVATETGDAATCFTGDDPRVDRIDQRSITWSPDSQRFAFALAAALLLADSDIFVVDVASGELTNLTDDGYDGRLINSDPDFESPEIDTVPTFTPDGTAITFIRSNWGVDDDASSTILAEVPVTGGEVTTLLAIDRDEAMVVFWRMAWLTDGTKLLYTVASVDQSDAGNGVWSYDRQSGESDQLAGRLNSSAGESEPGYAIFHSVSSSGQTALVISSAFFSGVFDLERTDWATLDLTTGKTQILPPDSGQGTRRVQPLVMAFSPNADLIAGVSRVIQSEQPDPPAHQLRFYHVARGEWNETSVAVDGLSIRDLWDMIWTPGDLLYIGRTAIFEITM